MSLVKLLRTRFTRDVYTIIMIALVLVIFLSAWGLTKASQRDLHAKQCAMAVEWLEESQDALPLFYRAGTMENTARWITTVEDISSPAIAGRLRWAVLQSARYSARYYPTNPTHESAILNPIDGLYERNIREGAQELIDHCPEVRPMLPEAFPMIFKEDDFS